MELKIKKKKLIRKGLDGVKNGILLNAFRDFFNGNSSRWPMNRTFDNKDTSTNGRHVIGFLGRPIKYRKGNKL